MSHFDYLVIGHITHDVTPSGLTIGGAAAYAGCTAQLLGCRTAVLTSAGPDCDIVASLPGLTVATVAAGQTTTFKNQYEGALRQQHLYHRAAPLGPADLPPGWQRVPLVHLGPVAAEVDPALIHQFSNSLVGLSPQGWLRCWDEQGKVTPCSWDEAGWALPLAAAVILSEEDLPDSTLLEEYRRRAPLLVLTQGQDGCTVFLGHEERHFAAPVVEVVDPTGAGDIFAAAFLVRLFQTRGNAWEAAEFANWIAAHSVTRPLLAGKMQHLRKIVEMQSRSR